MNYLINNNKLTYNPLIDIYLFIFILIIFSYFTLNKLKILIFYILI
jgi:hypothetical protein